MKRIAAIHAYDRFEDVVVSFRVREYESYGDLEGDVVEAGTVSFPSTGEDGAARWLRDALVALAETL